MNHPNLEELTLMIHGLLPVDPHVPECPSCRGTAERLRGELVLLREAESRVRPPGRLSGGFLRFLPLALAAGVLLGVLGAVLLHGPPSAVPGQTPASQDTRIRDLVRTFLKGEESASSQARRELVGLGPSALPFLIEARQKGPGGARGLSLGELIFECKSPPPGDPAKPVYEKFKPIRITIDMQDAPLTAVVDYIREISSLSIVINSAAEAASSTVSLRIQDATLPRALDTLLGGHALDYDFRYGVLFIDNPNRLWAAPPDPRTVLAPADAQKARAWILALSSDKPEERERASLGLRELGPPVLPILREGAKSTDAEVIHRCRSLIEELTPRADAALPIHNHWRTQTLSKAGQAVAARLDNEKKKLDLAFENASFTDLIAFLVDFAGLKIVNPGVVPKAPVTLKVKALRLSDILELLTLPYGLDARIDEGTITLFERKK